jgi:hypothetical protein
VTSTGSTKRRAVSWTNGAEDVLNGRANGLGM